MGLIQRTTAPARQAVRLGGRVADEGMHLVDRVRGRIRASDRPKDLDDVTIARKVETELFRPGSVDKGKINIDVVDGVVYLRGTAKNPAQLRSLEKKARAIPEVREVQNLLHLPKTPAPTRTAPSRTKQATRQRGTTGAATPRTGARTVNADKTSGRTGDSPEELAKERKGRQPAKLGSERPR